MQKVISFPHMGNYHVPVEVLLKLLFKNHKVEAAPKITKKTLELGSKYSPDFVCVPFKYNLGNYIEALDKGANVLIQAGGGCRFGYYAEIQEQILRDMGYKFEFIKLFGDNINPINLYKNSKKIGTDISFGKFLYIFVLIIKMVNILDTIEAYIRENIGFEVIENSFENLQKKFLNELKTVKNLKALKTVYKKYDKSFKELPINKPDNCLKVGLVGELYTLMEPFSNYFIEKELAKNKIQVSRFITVTFLLFQKSLIRKKILNGAGKYLKYEIGADGTDSVEKSKMLAEKGYDGIIHLKPFGCMPEVNAMPILQNIGKDYKIPILYFSFDSQTSETGVKTRLEAFYDMLLMRKEIS
ncbi:MAG: hypothetical protein K0S55_1000 [Clostridia bacterium]|nr:hypothetical protein [Clostridia bacterium]